MKSGTVVVAIALFAALGLQAPMAAQHAQYKVIDLGTLGRPSAYGQGDGPGTTQLINGAGTVVGLSDTSIPFVVDLLTEATAQDSKLTFAMPLTSATTVTVSPTSLIFSTQAIGTVSPGKYVTLKNTGTLILTVNSIAIIGTNRGDFFISASTCGASLAASASCTIKVKFKPTALETRSAVLSFTDDAAGSPQTVTLSGVGTTAKISPTQLNFGFVGLDVTSLAKTVTLTNVGTTTLTITDITITGTDASEFLQISSCGTSLAAGAYCHISISFRPAALGTRKAVLSITDDAVGSPQTVPLSGTGGTGGTLTGYCVHNLGGGPNCGLTSDTSQCPPGEPAINPVHIFCNFPFQSFHVDEARRCSVVVNGLRFGGRCQYH